MAGNAIWPQIYHGGLGRLLHAGLGSAVSTTHFGFDSNDANGATNSLSTNVWYHVAFVYDTTITGGITWTAGGTMITDNPGGNARCELPSCGVTLPRTPAALGRTL